jgi:hypothetical protein
MKTAFFFLMTLFSLQVSADVIGKNGEVIKVERSKAGTETYISFTYCDGQGLCRLLGPSQFYTEKKLKKQKMREAVEVGLAGVGSIGLVAGSVVTGGLAGTAVVGGGSYIAILFDAFVIGGGVGLAAGTATVVTWDTINPVNQLRHSRVVRDSVLEDKEIHLITKGGMKKFVKALEKVLEKI